MKKILLPILSVMLSALPLTAAEPQPPVTQSSQSELQQPQQSQPSSHEPKQPEQSEQVQRLVNELQYSMIIGMAELPTEKQAPPHFTWGVDIGSSIDMTGQDLTAINLDAAFGYKGDYVRFAGVGAGIKMMVSNSSRCYPVYAMFRSSFTRKPTLCFAQLKLGVSFNNFYTDIYQRNLYSSLGLGFTLATGRSFSSHIVLAYEFMPVKKTFVPDAVSPLADIHSASITIGASF